jgi:hypothetical protein
MAVSLETGFLLAPRAGSPYSFLIYTNQGEWRSEKFEKKLTEYQYNLALPTYPYMHLKSKTLSLLQPAFYCK